MDQERAPGAPLELHEEDEEMLIVAVSRPSPSHSLQPSAADQLFS